MATPNAFGNRYAPPIVTYGVAPKSLQKAQPDTPDQDRDLGRNIAGIVTPAAAITLGVLAFATTSDIPHSSPPIGNSAQTTGQTGLVLLPEREATPSQVEPVETVPSFAESAVVPAEETQSFSAPQAARALPSDPPRNRWKPAQSGAPVVSVDLRAVPVERAALVEALPDPVSPPMDQDVLFPIKLASGVEKNSDAIDPLSLGLKPAQEPLELTLDDEIEIVLASAPAPDSNAASEFVRRDYSRTLATKDQPRDFAVEEAAPVEVFAPEQPQLAINAALPDPGAVAQVRKKIEAVKRAPLPRMALKNTLESGSAILSAEKQDGVSGIIAGPDVSSDAGKVTSVSLGALLDLVEGQLDPSDYAAFASSSHALGHVSTAQLEAAGLGVEYDAASRTLSLFAVG